MWNEIWKESTSHITLWSKNALKLWHDEKLKSLNFIWIFHIKKNILFAHKNSSSSSVINGLIMSTAKVQNLSLFKTWNFYDKKDVGRKTIQEMAPYSLIIIHVQNLWINVHISEKKKIKKSVFDGQKN